MSFESAKNLFKSAVGITNVSVAQQPHLEIFQYGRHQASPGGEYKRQSQNFSTNKNAQFYIQYENY